ncbi:MAG: PhnD/SsuA/transferrin family substrate-binding protein [Planctomycetes bacterium]|nr:PhnD/SsuA/transferrin family substrate-binding protein [Planctomycetota bacterium]
MSLAALPWYDFAELRAQTDAWWAGIARHLRALGVERVPKALLRGRALAEHWRHPELLLSQACGYDVLYDHADAIVPVATPCYLAEGCEGPRYRSNVVVRADRPWCSFAQLRGLRVAVNEASSHSGNNAMRPQAASLQRAGTFFGEVVVTGTHVESLRALQAGAVDAACIDAVVLALLRRVRPALVSRLRRVAHTCVALAPPYVTSRRTSPEVLLQLRQALLAAARDPALREAREALLLRDFVVFPTDSYAELEDFEESAVAVGYLQLPAPSRSPLGRREERA